MSKIHSVNCIGQMAGIDPAIRPGWLYGNQVFNGAANITPADMNYLLSICRNRLCKLYGRLAGRVDSSIGWVCSNFGLSDSLGAPLGKRLHNGGIHRRWP